jgi:hypothetical protein
MANLYQSSDDMSVRTHMHNRLRVSSLQSYRVVLYKVLQPYSSCFMSLHAAADPRLPQVAVAARVHLCNRVTCRSAAFSVSILNYRGSVCSRIARRFPVRRQGAALPKFVSRMQQSCTAYCMPLDCIGCCFSAHSAEYTRCVRLQQLCYQDTLVTNALHVQHGLHAVQSGTRACTFMVIDNAKCVDPFKDVKTAL